MNKEQNKTPVRKGDFHQFNEYYVWASINTPRAPLRSSRTASLLARKTTSMSPGPWDHTYTSSHSTTCSDASCASITRDRRPKHLPPMTQLKVTRLHY